MNWHFRPTPGRALIGVVGIALATSLAAFASSLTLTSHHLTVLSTTVTVPKSTPTVTTSAGSGGTVGTTSVSDSATLTNGTANAGGQLTFSLWGPALTPTCATQVGSSSVVSVSGATNNTYPSGSISPTTAGSYYWTVSYDGDSNNNSISETACGATGETVVITKATPTLVTSPAPSTLIIGNTAADQATLSGGFGTLGGTLSYTLYQPTDTTCSGSPAPLTPSANTVSGSATYTSGTVSPSSTGTWHWIAKYSGDANNNPVTGPCSGTGSEPLTVSSAVSASLSFTGSSGNAICTSTHGANTFIVTGGGWSPFVSRSVSSSSPVTVTVSTPSNSPAVTGSPATIAANQTTSSSAITVQPPGSNSGIVMTASATGYTSATCTHYKN